jgi:hypothetical protein
LTVTFGALRAVIQTFRKNGIIEAPRIIAPIVDTWFSQVQPSAAESSAAAHHAVDAQPVLDEEGHVEADEQHPEVHHAEPLVEHAPRPLGPPEVEAREHREHDRAEHHVVEVRDDEVRVGEVEVERRRREDHTGQTAEDERYEEAEREHHRRLERHRSPPQGRSSEDLHARRHGDQSSCRAKNGEQHRSAGHGAVVSSHRDHGAAMARRVDERLVAEDRLAAEHRKISKTMPKNGKR